MHLSVIIITLNEEKNLFRTLQSLQELKESNLGIEVLVLDSGSTDRTESIAKESGAKFAVQNWLGYSNQKNHALTISQANLSIPNHCNRIVLSFNLTFNFLQNQTV